MSELRLRVLVDHEVVRELDVRAPLSIGRAADNDLVLDDDAVSSHHGRVEVRRDGWSYADAGSVNGSLVAAGPRLGRDEHVPLSELTQVLVGRTVLEFVPPASGPRDDDSGTPAALRRERPRAPAAPGPEAATASPPAAHVVVVEQDARRLVRLVPPRVRIGRGPECELRVSCASVSQQHAELRADADGWRLRDLGSTNGTRVGLVPLVGEKRLASGSHLILGELDLFFVLDDAAPPAAEQSAFLDWLRRERELDAAQLERARAVQRAEDCGVDAALVQSGALSPGRLTELRRQAGAAARPARGRRGAASGASEDRRAEDDGSAVNLLGLTALLVVLAALAWWASVE